MLTTYMQQLRTYSTQFLEEELARRGLVGGTLTSHMLRQIAFSHRAFGPGPRHQGVVDHIRKELREIEEDPSDIEEWIDVALLALDGAWRTAAPDEDRELSFHEREVMAVRVAAVLQAKLAKNERREWPDWRTADRTKAIEHDRTKEASDGR